jgi:hypothetical protein
MMTDHADAENPPERHTERLEQEAGEYINVSERLCTANMFDTDLGIGRQEGMEGEWE